MCFVVSPCHCNAKRHTIKIYFCNFFGMFDIFNLDLKLINILMPISHPYHNWLYKVMEDSNGPMFQRRIFKWIRLKVENMLSKNLQNQKS